MLTARRRARRLFGAADKSRRHRGGTPPAAIAAASAITVGVALRSPVAAVIVAGYVLIASAFMRRRAVQARQHADCLRALDQLNAYAARTRAGAPGELLLLPDPDLDAMVRAAQHLAERSGAPLADLLDRIEDQRRGQLRMRAAAQAQAAGARVTAILLAALPIGGLGLGYLIGADPLAVLLHTPVGAACAIVAAMLQAAGLIWSEKLSGTAPAPSATRRRRPRTRLRRLVPADTGPISRRMTTIAAAAGAALTLLLIPGWPGVPVALAIAAATAIALPRLPSPAARQERQRLTQDLPLAADLTAAALRAGAPVDDALLAVASAMTGPASQRLTQIGRSLRLGATTEQAWQHLLDLPAGKRLAVAAVRSASSGSALAGALTRCADDLRADSADARQAAAQRAGVLIVLPLGLCFLPAFVLAGLVPVVLAVLGEVL